MPFPPWVPDLSDQETQTSQTVQNVYPRADGWGPFPSFTVLTSALPAPCLGFFFARNSDNSVAIFAGTAASKLYLLNNSTFTWTDVSQGGGTYAALSTGTQWQFEQFNNFVIAVQGNVNPQVFNLASPTAFADLAGSPPQAGFVSIINRFVVLSHISGNTYRVQWSDLDNITQWTAGVGQADFQDLPDGGITFGIAGFDLYAVILQNDMARLMTYAPGSPVIFTITKITGGDGNGVLSPYGFVIDQDNVFWLSQEGVKQLAPGGAPQPIGKELVDRFLAANVDASNPQLIQFTTDPAASRMFVSFKSTSGQAGLFDTIVIYDWRIQRWSKCMFSGQYLNTFSKPGLTLENMDSVTPNALAITGASAGTGGVIRLTVSSTAGIATAAQQTVYGVWNVTQISGSAPFLAAIYNKQNSANISWGQWPITVFDGTHVELTGSVFAGSYTSGGILGGNLDVLPFSLDTVSTVSTIPALAAFNSSNQLGFFNGPASEAIIETQEQGSNEKRMFVKGFRVITDAPVVFGSVSYRDNPQAPYKYTSEVLIDQMGVCLVQGGGIDTRYARARIRIPAGTVWTYAMAIEPDAMITGSY